MVAAVQDDDGGQQCASAAVVRCEEVRRLRLHELAFAHLQSLPLSASGRWRTQALRNLDRVAVSVRGEAGQAAVRQWRYLLRDRPLAEITQVCLAGSEEADLLRVVSPLAGLLPDAVRLQVLDQTRRSR